MKNIALSVIIPVYYTIDKDRQIKALLMSLSDGTNLDYISEIIIVDNGILFPQYLVNEIKEWSKVKVAQEPCVGLSSARNKGIEVSSGDIKAFIDDDCIVCEDWAKSILKGYKNSSILCVGGPVVFQNNAFYPLWFSNFFSRFIVPPVFPKISSVIKAPFYLVGANMSFRRECFTEYGWFDIDLGRKKNRLLSGEEIEYMLRIPKEKIWYEKDARMTTIGQLNIKRTYFIKRLFWQGISDALMAKKHGKQKLYDIGELSFSLVFLKNGVQSIMCGKYFQCFCMMTRFAAFNLAYFVLKFK